ncbi:MAG: hypothetical protein M1814_004493 [Vezdaea aestivalis]|nr:MAG: hypothetical protein M1814_004493 [Vezdaea aestivalis]
MADTQPQSSSSALPPPQSSSGPPGIQQYDNGGANQQSAPGTSSHMPPPPLPPVIIPQNTNPIPTAMTSPLSGAEGGMMSPISAGGFVRRAAPEPNKRALYIGGLDPRVTEDILKEIFGISGHIQNVKIIPDKNYQSKGFNYGFVEFDDPGAAEKAMSTLNGRRIHNSEIRVNWAYQSNTTSKEDTSGHFHIFVGDLSNEVNDEVLLQAFSAFGSVSEARVMWDMKTGRSRGYGFVAFRDRSDAEKALAAMDGEWLGSRAIRCNWANQKGQPSISTATQIPSVGGGAGLVGGGTPTTPYGHHNFPTQGVNSYDMVFSQTPKWQTTIYVGNLTPYTTPQDLVPLFQPYGQIAETRCQADRGFAFVKMHDHEAAAMAICQLNGFTVNGRPLKCSWGKDRPPTGTGYDAAFSPQGGPPNTPGSAYPQNPQNFFPGQYNSPGGPMTPQGGHNPGPPQQWNQTQPGGYQGQGGYGQMPTSAGGYGRGQPMDNQWAGQPANASYGGNNYPYHGR